MDSIVSSQKPFGLGTKFTAEYSTQSPSRVLVYGSTGSGYTDIKNIAKSRELIDKYKVFIPAAGSGSDSFPHPILGKPFVGVKGTVCSETYVVIGPCASRSECENLISYIATRTFRFLVMLKKPTQHALKGVYSYVPILDFSESWSDEKLYKRYGFTNNEIAFIESMIRPMELGGDDDGN